MNNRKYIYPLAAVVLVCAATSSRAQMSTPAEAPATQSSSAEANSIPPDQQASKEQLAKLFDLMRIRAQMQTYMQMMPNMFRQQFQEQMQENLSRLPENQRPSPEVEAKLERLIGGYMDRAMKEFSTDDLIADMTMVYQRHINRTDTDSLIAFYSSPAGQHLLDAQPAIMKEYTPMVMERSKRISTELNEQMLKDINDLVKSAPPAETPAPAQPPK